MTLPTQNMADFLVHFELEFPQLSTKSVLAQGDFMAEGYAWIYDTLWFKSELININT